MKSVFVRLRHASYPIRIGMRIGNIGQAILAGVQRPPKRALIVSHNVLIRKFAAAITKDLKKAGIRPAVAVFPEGEKNKNLKTVQSLYRRCLKEKLDRTSCLIALGGGVVGDVAGFVAATYLRGISLFHIPTTLLAMVDSSIGGKVGVDLNEAKNFIGSFYQPKSVLIDIETLKTLPERELRNGMAEVIKYGIIADRSLFGRLEEKMCGQPSDRPRFLQSDSERQWLTSVIARCAEIKAKVVSQDERETKGFREILNFGHTWGHAIETFTKYRLYKHGEAISIGMCAAGQISERLKLWTSQERIRMERLLSAAGLPLRLKKQLPPQKILRILARDKKNVEGSFRFVLPARIGEVIVKKISVSTALEGLKYVQPGTGRS